MARRRVGMAIAVLAAAAVVALVLRPWERPEAGPIDADGAGPAAPTTLDGDRGPGALAARGVASDAAGAVPAPRRRPVPVPDGPRLVGRVVDPAGAGVAGARVLALPDTLAKPLPSSEVGTDGRPGAENFTDADGRFVVAAVGDAPLFAVVAEAAGYAPGLASSVRPGVETTVVLRRGARLSGRVLTMEAEPVADAVVRVEAVVDVVHFVWETRSGPDGAYALAGIVGATSAPFDPFATAVVLATKEGFAPLFVPSLGRAVPGKPDERALDLVLVRGATLSGRVVDAGDGTAVAGATVVLWSVEGMVYLSRPSGSGLEPAWSPRTLGEATTDADGRFRFEHVPAHGFHRVQTPNSGRRGMLLGYVGAWKDGTAFGSAEVPVTADGRTLEVEVSLRAAGTASGRVVDAAGKPVADASVSTMPKVRGEDENPWVPPFLEGRAPRPSTKTDAEGRYRIAGAPGAAEGLAVTVSAWPPATFAVDGVPLVQMRGFEQPTAEVEIRAGGEAAVPDLVLRAPKGGAEATPRVLLVVTDGAGAPIAGATAATHRGGWRFTEGGPGASRSDRDGRLWVPVPQARRGGPVPPLVARAAGYAPAPVAMPASPKAGEEVRVTLGPARSVAGRVRQADGAPAAGAGVTVYNGAVSLAALLPKPGMPPIGPPVSAPGGPALVQYGWASTGEDGTFTVTGLPDGPYHVVASGRYARPGTPAPPPATLSDVATDAAGLELTLGADPRPAVGRIRGSVVDAATGRPVAAPEVTVARRPEAGDPPPGPTMVRSEDGSSTYYFAQPTPTVERPTIGRFEIAPVLRGRHDLTVTARGYTPARVDGVFVGPDDVELPPVALGRGARVRGRLRWPDGDAGADRAVQFVRVDGAPGGGTAERVGSTYEVTGLLPGSYRVTAPSEVHDGEEPPPVLREDDAPVVVPEGSTEVTADLVFVAAAVLRVNVAEGRLPPPSWEGPGTDAQRAFGRASSLTITRASGDVVGKADALESGLPPGIGWLLVLPGSYTVRLSMPEGEVSERTVTVAAGGTAEVSVGRGRPGR